MCCKSVVLLLVLQNVLFVAIFPGLSNTFDPVFEDASNPVVPKLFQPRAHLKNLKTFRGPPHEK